MAISVRSRLEKLERQLGRPQPVVEVADLARLLQQELVSLSARSAGPDADAAKEILRVGAASDGDLRHLSGAALALLRKLLEARSGPPSAESDR